MNIYSKIDSERYGIIIGKIESDFFDEQSIEEGIDYFRENDYELIFTRIDYKNLELINKLEQCGFTVKDTQCTLRNVFKDRNGDYLFTQKDRTDGYKIREFKNSDTEMIVDIAKSSFNNYGHYGADKRLNPKDTLDAYIDWTYNCCINKNVATKIFVAEKNGDVAGYIAYKKFVKEDKNFVQEDKTYAAGVIGAVSPNHRGKGLFPDIDIAALEWGIANNFDWEEHNVLMDNYAVFKSHMKVGFRPHNFMITLHGWIDELKL